MRIIEGVCVAISIYKSVPWWCLSNSTKTKSRFFKNKILKLRCIWRGWLSKKRKIKLKFRFVIFLELCSTRAVSNLYIFNFTKRSTPWLTHWITYVFFLKQYLQLWLVALLVVTGTLLPHWFSVKREQQDKMGGIEVYKLQHRWMLEGETSVT